MSPITATLDSSIRCRREVLFRELAGEAVLLDLESGQYYGLDEVGTRIWSLLREEATPAAVLGRLLREYEASEERLERDLLRLIDDLVQARLVEIAPSTQPPEAVCNS